MRPVLALCLLSLTLAGCGAAASRDSSEDFDGAQRAVAASIENLEAAARDNDSEQVCTGLLADDLLARLKSEGKDCAMAVEDAFSDADSVELTVEGITINATKATAKVTSGTGSNETTETLELEKAGALWKLASL